MTKSIKQLAEEWMKDMEFKLAYSQADAVSKFASYLDSYLDSSYTLLEKSKTVDLGVEECGAKAYDTTGKEICTCKEHNTCKFERCSCCCQPRQCEHEWDPTKRHMVCKKCNKMPIELIPTPPEPMPELPEEIKRLDGCAVKSFGTIYDVATLDSLVNVKEALNKVIRYLKARE